MKRFLVASAFAVLAMTTSALAQSVDVQAEDVRAEFQACMRETTQACLWKLADHLDQAIGGEGDGANTVEALSSCLANPTADCVERVRERIQEEQERSANNPAAAVMRDICLDEPSPECLITVAMAYANTATASGTYQPAILQAFQFVSDGQVIVASSERSFLSASLSQANLMHLRWLLAQEKLDEAKDFVTGSAAFHRTAAATAEKLLAIALAESGDFQEAFGFAEVLYTQDSDWADRFELIMPIIARYAAAAPDTAPAWIEQLPGTTDQAAGFAGLTLALARSGQLEQASSAFQKAMARITLNVDTSARDKGLTVLAKELGNAGAFELSRDAIVAMSSDLQTEWAAFDLASAMFAAGQHEEALTVLNSLAPDHGESRYYYLVLTSGRTDLERARSLAAGLEEPFRTYGAQGLVRALFEAGQLAEAITTSEQFGLEFGNSPSFGTDIPAFAAALASEGRVAEAVALAASTKLSTMAFAFAAIAVELKGGDWWEVVELSSTD